VAKFDIVVIWITVLYSPTGTYQHFGGRSSNHLLGIMIMEAVFLWNSSTHLVDQLVGVITQKTIEKHDI